MTADLKGDRPDFLTQLRSLTSRVSSAHVIASSLVEGQQAKRVLTMSSNPVLIKGLSEAMTAAKKSIADARLAPAALTQAAADLKATCEGLTAQVNAMHDDIKFEASQLGNGGEQK